LILRQLKLTNYKNYSSLAIDTNYAVVVITGQNGVGKTNILDAIHHLSFGRSLFQRKDSIVVKEGESFYRLEGQYNGKPTLQVVVKFSKDSKKLIEQNKKKLNKVSDHIGAVPLVFIGPRDIQLFFEGSKDRRKFIDAAICQYDKSYLRQLMIYNRILLQRNSYLKSTNASNVEESLLRSYDKQLIGPANYIHQARAAYIADFNVIFENVYKDLSAANETATTTYISQLTDNDIGQMLEESTQKDIYLQRTTKGIHKDDLTFILDGRALKQFGSEGQLKTFLLGLKLAQWTKIKDETKLLPILLLDDIFAKLDASRVKNLLTFINDKDMQVFVSDTDKQRVSEILKMIGKSHVVYSVQNETAEKIYET